MASRLTYASVLMAAINKKIIDAKILPAEIVRQLRMHNDSNINQQLDRLWGISRSSSKTKLDEIKKYKRIVGMRSNRPGNLSNGRALFNRVCASCHKLYGHNGLGILYGKKKWLDEMHPYQGGGGMIDEVKKEKR